MPNTTPFYLLNVFAESHFGGNPLAVFPAADGLNDETMQLIARQFNLSETVFVKRAARAEAVKQLRIFTPAYEMPFAGHPTVGAAYLLQKLLDLPPHYRLETPAGLVDIAHDGGAVTLALDNGIQTAASDLSREAAAALLGLAAEDVAAAPMWVNTGTWQLLLPLASFEAVARCRVADAAAFMRQTATDFGKPQIYVWALSGDTAKVRLFFGQDGAVLEDPGTGSAAANLGGWLWQQRGGSLALNITQGDELARPNRLLLRVDDNGVVSVGGKVIEVGRGVFMLP
ncbi:PhzF family phenazine biosynthesis protein [Bergeriella denitrificans]|uniref:Trans-2,3-dihydro-3-hydroxyanthranilate isomerase n=1 Tax=Bergeriella denitrificans TaxID=494 RepID=A0A378UDL5_BERDE|nr:PhzF family phenazine biosynthesis protein [Bergeriella denitrificans]STZ75498.1 Trans-2,3-dihydro-3-hydroxyanthranilate isomerase [Bergeriella denitrificans]